MLSALWESEYFVYFALILCSFCLALAFDRLSEIKRLKKQKFALKFLNLLTILFLFILLYHVAVIYVQSSDLHQVKPIIIEIAICIMLTAFALFKVADFSSNLEKSLLKKGHEPTSVKCSPELLTSFAALSQRCLLLATLV